MTIRIIATYLTLMTLSCNVPQDNSNINIKDSIAITQIDSNKISIDSSAAYIEYKYVDNPKRPNVIIDNFIQLQENCKKIQLDTVINFNFLPYASNSNNELYFTKSFVENSLFHLPLKNLLIGKDKENTWAGYEIFYNEYPNFDSIDKNEVVPTSSPIELISIKNINIFFLENRYLLIFDSLNNYIGGFDAKNGMGNSHGATNINTIVYPDLKIEILINDWNESGNPNGRQIINTDIL